MKKWTLPLICRNASSSIAGLGFASIVFAHMLWLACQDPEIVARESTTLVESGEQLFLIENNNMLIGARHNKRASSHWKILTYWFGMPMYVKDTKRSNISIYSKEKIITTKIKERHFVS